LATTHPYTLALHDALPISDPQPRPEVVDLQLCVAALDHGSSSLAQIGTPSAPTVACARCPRVGSQAMSREQFAELQRGQRLQDRDRKSTRLNSSHQIISYA